MYRRRMNQDEQRVFDVECARIRGAYDFYLFENKLKDESTSAISVYTVLLRIHERKPQHTPAVHENIRKYLGETIAAHMQHLEKEVLVTLATLKFKEEMQESQKPR